VSRTAHDQLMKQALRERFADFLRLFDPDTAAGLDLDAGVTFRDTETFTDLPQGALLIPDIVAEVRTRDGVPKLVIVHVEVQREREDEDFPHRMWRYFISLTLREDAPVIPVALLFYQTAEGVAYEVYEETLFGHTIVTFRYLQISLARLAPQAYDYLHTGNILAIALASIMGRSLRGTRRARLYFACLRRLLDAEQAGEINRAVTRLLGAVIDTDLPVNVEDRVALRVQLQAEGQGGEVMVRLTDFPQLRLLAWNRSSDDVLDDREALALYEANWRFVDPARLSKEERALIDRLVTNVGRGVLLV